MAKPNNEQYTAAQMIEALKATRGMKTLAAKRLGCAYNTVVRYIDKYPTVKQAQHEAHEGLGDAVETTLISQALGKQAKDGEYTRAPNITALIFLAKTRFKDRGYVERSEHTGKDGEAITVKVVYDDYNPKTSQTS
jgi:hypothetical protein